MNQLNSAADRYRSEEWARITDPYRAPETDEEPWAPVPDAARAARERSRIIVALVALAAFTVVCLAVWWQS